MTQVLIRNGVYRNKPVHNEVFELVRANIDFIERH